MSHFAESCPVWRHLLHGWAKTRAYSWMHSFNYGKPRSVFPRMVSVPAEWKGLTSAHTSCYTQLPPELLVMHTVSLLLAFATNILAFEDDFGDIDQGFPPLLNMTDNICSRSEECIPQELCPYFQEDVTRLEQLPEESREYKEMVANMQRFVCNKKEKGFCCSLIETNSIIGGPAQKCCR